MKREPQNSSRKLGADRRETAVKTRTKDKNFRQSRDLHEDRGERQMKTGTAPRTAKPK